MIGLIMVLIGVVMVIAGFTGRWRALLHSVFPTFAARLGVARNG
jgi:hypothetical protein